MAHTNTLDPTITKTEEHPEQSPPAQAEVEELTDEQLQAVSGGDQNHIIPCLLIPCFLIPCL
jgi:bacteriocin-like protein